MTDFDAKYASTLELVKGDIALGQQLRSSQTPTFFINGVKVDGAWAPQFFDQAIAVRAASAREVSAHVSSACRRWPPTT